MQIELSTVVALLAVLVAVGTAIISGVSKYAANTRDSEINRRLGQNETLLLQLTQRLHEAELSTTRTQGEVNVLRATHQGFEADISEIKDQMIRRDEWETRMSGLDKRLDDIAAALRPRAAPGLGRYTGSTSDPSMPPIPRQKT